MACYRVNVTLFYHFWRFYDYVPILHSPITLSTVDLLLSGGIGKNLFIIYIMVMFQFVKEISLHLFFLYKAKVDGFKSPLFCTFEVVTLVTGNAGDVMELHPSTNCKTRDKF